MNGPQTNSADHSSADDAHASDAPRLLVSGVSKTFGSTRVLKDMEISLQPGEMHGLVGQNGSGKSTLVKLLTGVHAPDQGGRIEVDGVSLGPIIRAPEMREAGLSVVHQTLGLIEDGSVLENVRVGRLRAARLTRRIDWDAERADVVAVLQRLGRPLDPDTVVSRLSAEDRATVAIARAFQDHEPGRGVIIFDESTRALTADALDRFYELVHGVRAAGAAVLLISHRLEEILQVTDRVTVLRDGEVTGAGVSTDELDEPKLVRLMLGRALRTSTPRPSVTMPPGDVSADAVIRVEELSGGALREFSLSVGPGEIAGVTGLIGSGFEEVPYLLSGARKATSGSLQLGGRRIELARGNSVASLIAAGVALVPERRVEEGLAIDLSVSDNLTLPRIQTRGRPWWAGRIWQREETDRMIAQLDIRPPQSGAIVGTLSGGNQQKVLLAKWLAGRPRLLLLHEPTQAVDVGAREDIIDAVRAAATAGCAVIVAGSDPQELGAMCDRVLVLRGGRIESEIVDDLDEDTIIRATFGSARALRDLAGRDQPTDLS